MKASDLLNLLGRDLHEPAVQSVIQQLGYPDLEEDEPSGFVIDTSWHGLELHLSDNKAINAIVLHTDDPNDELLCAYRGELPMGLSFSMTRDDVRKLLGSPIASGEGTLVLGLQLQAWDNFVSNQHRYQIKYVDDTNNIASVWVEGTA